jgi:hypothetical protein
MNCCVPKLRHFLFCFGNTARLVTAWKHFPQPHIDFAGQCFRRFMQSFFQHVKQYLACRLRIGFGIMMFKLVSDMGTYGVELVIV